LNNEEFFAKLKGLIVTWCDRHALRPLARVLGPFTAFNGLTDSWGELLEGLKSVRALCRDDLSEPETGAVEELIRGAEHAVYRGGVRPARFAIVATAEIAPGRMGEVLPLLIGHRARCFEAGTRDPTIRGPAAA
jgi:hypothetical protein